MIVRMICSSAPWKKEISAPAVLIIQLGSDECCFCEVVNESSSIIGFNVTGTIVSFVIGKRKAPPSFDISIVPEVHGCLNALFDYGLTLEFLISQLLGHQLKNS